jgi:hypothetical protein
MYFEGWETRTFSPVLNGIQYSLTNNGTLFSDIPTSYRFKEKTICDNSTQPGQALQENITALIL